MINIKFYLFLRSLTSLYVSPREALRLARIARNTMTEAFICELLGIQVIDVKKEFCKKTVDTNYHPVIFIEEFKS